nr:TCP-1/cpn60 chaperonin family protein [Candidatus Sigynarchaeota archaeon]
MASDLGTFFSSALGNSMTKLIEDPHGNFTATSDGTTLIHELHLRYKHPIISLLLEAGDVQGRMHGDLAKMTIVLACNLVIGALSLMDQGVHPTNVKNGFYRSSQQVMQQIAQMKRINSIVVSAVQSELEAFLALRLSPAVARHLANLVGRPFAEFLHRNIQKLAQGSIDSVMVDLLDEIGMLIHPGGQIVDSFIFPGTGIIKDPVSWKEIWTALDLSRVENIRVAFVTGELYLDKKRIDSMDVKCTSTDGHQLFKEGLEQVWINKAPKLLQKKVNVLVTEKGIDDALISALQASIPPVLIFKRTKIDEMKRMARYLGGNLVYDIDHLEDSDLGYAKTMHAQQIRNDMGFFFVNEESPSFYTLVIRGAFYDICDAVKQNLTSAMRSMLSSVHGGILNDFPYMLTKIVKDSRGVKDPSMQGKAALAMDVFLDAMDSLPRSMAINQGFDPYDTAVTSTFVGLNVPVDAVKSMIEIATSIATSLIGVDALFVNKEGWQKRIGKNPTPASRQEKS